MWVVNESTAKGNAMCKKGQHNNLIIHEEWIVPITTVIRNGKFDSVGSDPTGDPNGWFHFECLDCDLDKRFHRNSIVPRWVRNHMNSILNRSTEDD